MIIAVFIIFLFAYLISVCFRLTVQNPVAFIYYLLRDLYHYFRYHKWRICQTGHLICYTALFGKGKTLSVVHYITSMYYRYNKSKNEKACIKYQ